MPGEGCQSHYDLLNLLDFNPPLAYTCPLIPQSRSFGTALKTRLLITAVLLLMVLLLQPSLHVVGQGGFPDLCKDSNNVLKNCNFSGGMDGWQPFTESGGVEIRHVSGGECDSPDCPDVRMAANGSFIGGIYQQVPASPGVTYWANVTWLVIDSVANETDGTFGRRIGIDPTGGTDPRSPNIAWSADLWRGFSHNEKIFSELQVKATAQNSTVTVFVRVDDTWRDRAREQGKLSDSVASKMDRIWIDDVGMIPIGGAAVPTDTPVPPTDTPIPPTDTPAPPTPKPAAPTATLEVPTETPTLEATDTPMPTPTDTPTPVPTDTPTLTPSPTPTETPTPEPTDIPEPTATPEPPFSDALAMIGGGVVCLGGVGLVVLLAIGGFLYWLYRLGTSEEAEDELDDADQEAVD
jgi:hypothetical protein